jgi:hypothetical protein
MKFQENVHHTAVGQRPIVNGFQQMKGVNRLNQRNIRKNQSQLVGLQMADKMPLYIGRHLENLGSQFLRAAFGKNPLPGGIGLPDLFHRVEFGNCHQLNT